MAFSGIIERLEFLAKYFSSPDRAFLGQIHEGRTPLDRVASGVSLGDFCEQAATDHTMTFVNCLERRPLYPLASEYLHESEIAARHRELATLYQAEFRTVVGYPPDHIVPLVQHTLFLLGDQRSDEAREFYVTHLRDWTTDFSKALLDRDPPTHIKRVAELLTALSSQFDELLKP